VRAEFIPGQRNAQVNHFYDKLGFRVVAETQGGGREYAAEGEIDAPPQIRFTEIFWE
jgi:predicted enzyme involved in methoxymalonyl-ACP biosynthesis